VPVPAGARDGFVYRLAASIDKAINLSLSVALNPEGRGAEEAEKKSKVEHVFKVKQSFAQPNDQGCQMVCFQTKKSYFGKFLRALEWKMLIYFMGISNILLTFGIFSDNLVQFVFFWYIFPVLVSCTKKNLASTHQPI
jgi:hypothetical protein